MPELTTRTAVEYKNLSERFNVRNSDFSKQYCAIYNVRIEKMRGILAERIESKWGDEYPVSRLHKVSDDNYPKCIVVGTLYKEQKLKPSVLKQLADANQLVPQPVHTHFTDETDSVWIEDELQRFQLIGDLIKPSEVVTGITCALLGHDMGKGKFMVEDYCFADFRPQIERPLIQHDTYIVFISGLDLMHVEKSLLSLQLFTNWLAGGLGSFDDIDVSKIVRLVIAGNSTRMEAPKSKATISMTSRTVESSQVIDAVKTLDAFLLQVCQVIDVDLMPGENDPSNHVLPQKSMHHCMFPYSATYKSMNTVCNPYEFDVAGVRILGTSGQPVTNILQYTDLKEPVDVLENCLRWNHLAPTAPDTLGCFPFYDNDPFIIEHCPHVLFAGCQEKFSTKYVQGNDGQKVRLICVPDFSTTFTACLLNLKNLNCDPVVFKPL